MRAIGYFRELEQERQAGDSLSRQSEAFLAFCAREGYEPAATFLDPASADSEYPGFRQMLDYLRRPEKGFVVVAVHDIERLGDELHTAARSLFQVESLGAHDRHHRPRDARQRRRTDAAARRVDGAHHQRRRRPGTRRHAPPRRPRRGAGAAPVRLRRRAQPPPRCRARGSCRRSIRLPALPARGAGHPAHRPAAQRGRPCHPARRRMEHGHHSRHAAQSRLSGHVQPIRRARPRQPSRTRLAR